MEDNKIDLNTISFEAPEPTLEDLAPLQEETVTSEPEVEDTPEAEVTPQVTEDTPAEPVVDEPTWKSEYDNAEAMFAALNELKNTPSNEVPAQEEYDEFIKGAIDYYKTTGDLTAYLEAKSVNYDEMSDKEIYAKDLRSKYPSISEKAFERLLDKNLENQFGFNDDDGFEGDDEMSLAQELLKATTDKLRSEFKDKQSKFAAPEKVDSTEPTEAELKAQAEATEKQLMSNPFVKDFVKNDSLTVKYGGEEFNFEPEDKEQMLDMTRNLNGFMQMFATGDDNSPVDFEKWFTVMAFAQNPDNFLKGVRTAAKAVGTQKVMDEIRNPVVKNTKNTTTLPQGSIKDQLLAAALKAKK
jgi:hypothetical protein